MKNFFKIFMVVDSMFIILVFLSPTEMQKGLVQIAIASLFLSIAVLLSSFVEWVNKEKK